VDYLSSALLQCNKAINSDYGTLTTTTNTLSTTKKDSNTVIDTSALDISPMFSRLRSLDRYLLPFQHQLLTRTDLYTVHDSIEDKLLLLLQQYNETKSTILQIELLNNAISILSPLLQDGCIVLVHSSNVTYNRSIDIKKRKSLRSTTYMNLTIEALQTLIDKPTRIGVLDESLLAQYHVVYELLLQSHLHKCTELVELLSSFLLSYNWNVNDAYMKDFIQLQMETYYILAENIAQRVTQMSIVNTTTVVVDTTVVDYRALGLTHEKCSEELIKLKTLVILCIQKGMYIYLYDGYIYVYTVYIRSMERIMSRSVVDFSH
jgi:hypothetical protein